MSPTPRRPASAPSGDGRSRRPQRATHSVEQIVETAIDLLDRGGVKGLTLRGLAAELGGGLGSIYWHVRGKDEVLALACDALMEAALSEAAATRPSRVEGATIDRAPDFGTDDELLKEAVSEVRSVALALFRQTQTHPWLAAQLQVQGAGGATSLRYWEAIGRPLARMGLTLRQQFHGSTAISGYVTGVAAEMSAQDHAADVDRPKDEQMDEIVDRWLADAADLPWIRSIAEEFRTHDDDEQFTAGLDLLLGGLVRQALEART